MRRSQNRGGGRNIPVLRAKGLAIEIADGGAHLHLWLVTGEMCCLPLDIDQAKRLGNDLLDKVALLQEDCPGDGSLFPDTNPLEEDR